MVRLSVGTGGSSVYSPGLKVGPFVFVSGQIGTDEQGALVAGGIGAETRQAIENLQRVLRDAGCTLDDVAMVNIYLTDFSRDYSLMNEVYGEFFSVLPPARATVEVAGLALDALIEVSAIVVCGEMLTKPAS